MKSDGWLTYARRVDSPNYDARPDGALAHLLVVHSISLPPGVFGGEAIEALFTNRLDTTAHPYFATLVDVRVSAHFLIRRDGALIQFVSIHDRAWHAGVSQWRGRSRCNDFSVGVELEGTDTDSFALPQYNTLAKLSLTLQRNAALTDVAAHSDVAPSRKTDPGVGFDWRCYFLALASSR